MRTDANRLVMTDRPQQRDPDALVIEIAKHTAIAIRGVAAEHGATAPGELVDALTLGGLLSEKNMPGAGVEGGRFIDVLEAEAPLVRRMIAEGRVLDAASALAGVRGPLALASDPDTDRMIGIGLAAEGVLLSLAAQYGLSKHDVLRIASAAIALVLVATTPESEIDDTIAAMLHGAHEKVVHWDAMLPSDEEMFGNGEEDEIADSDTSGRS